MDKELLTKCLDITGSFEGASWDGVAGNFDGAGASFFILQWNFYSKTAQGLLYSMYNANIPLFKQICGDEKAFDIVNASIAGTHYEEQAFITKITTGRMHKAQGDGFFDGGVDILPDWKETFKTLGDTFKDQQLAAANVYLNAAIDMCNEFGLKTERAVAFMFDQAVQRGKYSVNDEERKYLTMKSNPAYENKSEKWWLNFIMDDDSADVPPEWRNDVLARRSCIINGAGMVHGAQYNLDKQFGLTDNIVL